MSNQEAMQQLTDRFMNDADFREQMRQDPEGAAQRSGLQLDEEDRQALKSIDWSVSDEAPQGTGEQAYSDVLMVPTPRAA